jgi:glycosyltransferase involved in cell wall biosynthesis
MTQLGQEVHIVTVGYKTADETKSQVANVHRVRVPGVPLLSAPSFWFLIRKRFVSLRKEVGTFDVVHGSSLSDLGLGKGISREPRVVTVHHVTRSLETPKTFSDWFNSFRGEGGLLPLLEPWSLRRADRLIAPSDYTKNELMTHYHLPSSRIEVINQGVRLEEFSPESGLIEATRGKLGIDDATSFLFVGRLMDPRKNLSYLLKAMALMVKTWKDTKVKLVIVGTDNQSSAKVLAMRLGISDRVVFTGPVRDEELRRTYSACDVHVIPSLLEGFGLTALEAMAACKPVIANRVGSLPELVKDGVNGITVKKGDLLSFAGAMHNFVEQPAMLSRMGNEGFRLASRYSWRNVAERTLDLYKSLTARGSHAA